MTCTMLPPLKDPRELKAQKDLFKKIQKLDHDKPLPAHDANNSSSSERMSPPLAYPQWTCSWLWTLIDSG